jgi:hypothetical protein
MYAAPGRARSSAGQSSGLIIRWSLVRIQAGPFWKPPPKPAFSWNDSAIVLFGCDQLVTNHEPEPSPDSRNEVTRRLQDLVVLPREDLPIELKGWLDLADGEQAADLGRALLAIANHGGGYVIVGFRERDGGWHPDAARPASLLGFSQDTVNSIVATYAEPIFHCDVHQIGHPETGDLFPVIVVPGGHRVPIRAKADSPERRHIRINTYYIRRPGPSSDGPRTGREWDELIGRCVRAARDELIDSIRAILAPEPESVAQADNHPDQQGQPAVSAVDDLEDWINESRARFEERLQAQPSGEDRFAHGAWTVAYALSGDLTQPSLSEFRDILQRIQGHETGWPPWLFSSGDEAPAPVGNTVEAFLYNATVFADPAHSDFWRAAPNGFLYLIRGYDDDSNPDRFPPGELFDVTLPIWEVAPCLLHAARLAEALGDSAAQVRVRVIWQGIAGRTLSTWATPRRVPPSRRPAVQDVVHAETSVSADRVRDNLPELMQELTEDLYASFDFFVPPPQLFREELARMRSGT